MIIGFLLTLVYYLATGLAGLLPTGSATMPQGFIDGILLVIGYLQSFTWLLPVDTLFDVVLFVVAFELTYLLAQFILWIIKLFRG